MGSNGDLVVECKNKYYTARLTANLKNVVELVDAHNNIKLPRFRCSDDPRPIFFELELSPRFATNLSDRSEWQKLCGFVFNMAAFNSDRAEDDSLAPVEGLPPALFVKAVRIKQYHYDENMEEELRISLPWKTWQKVQFLHNLDAYLEADYVPPNSLEVFFEVEYGLMITEDNSLIPAAPEHKVMDDLSTDFLALLESGDGADFHFVVGGERIPAHRLILSARSEYFRGLFRSGMKDSATGETTLKDYRPEDIKDILRGIYGGVVRADMTSKEAMAVLPLADEYCLDLIKEACCDVLLRNMMVEDVCEVLMMADLLNCNKLKVRCQRMVKQHYDEVKEQDGWKELRKKAGLYDELILFISE